VRGHHGALAVSSSPGRGSVFTVLLPRSELAPAIPAPGSAALPKASGLVLIVDDEDIVRRAARMALERYGYNVLVAETGVEGVSVSRGLAPQISVVLLDLTMPGMGGEEAFLELKKIRPDVKVILSSGYNEDETLQRFAGDELAGFIQKPYTSQALVGK